jgi:low temperature requirement protein LtrA
MGYSYFVSQFDHGGRDMQVILLGAMGGVLTLVANMRGGALAHPLGLPVTYLTLRLGLAFLYRGYRGRYPKSRPLYNWYVTGWTAGAALWGLSLLVPVPLRWTVWVGALGLEIATPVTAHVTVPRTPRHVSHMPERFGLFTLIVLGETVLSVVQGVGGEWRPVAVVISASAFLTSACLWFIYFDDLDESVISAALAGGRRDLVLSYVFGYAHLFVFASIVSAGVGVRILTSEPGRAATAGRLLFGLGIVVFLLACTVTHSIGPRPLSRPMMYLRLVIAAAVLAAAVAPLPPLALSLAVTGLLVTLVLAVVLREGAERTAFEIDG